MGHQATPIEVVRAFRALVLEGEDMAALAREVAATGEPAEVITQALELVAPDFDFDFTEAPYRGIGFHRYHGRRGIIEFWTDFLEVWSEFRARTLWIEESGDVVAAETEVTGTSRAGIPTAYTQGELWYVRDSLLSRCRAFATRADAIAALEADREAEASES